MTNTCRQLVLPVVPRPYRLACRNQKCVLQTLGAALEEVSVCPFCGEDVEAWYVCRGCGCYEPYTRWPLGLCLLCGLP